MQSENFDVELVNLLSAETYYVQRLSIINLSSRKIQIKINLRQP